MAQPFRRRSQPSSKKRPFQYQKRAVEKSPGDKCPCGAMPQSAQKENSHQIEIGSPSGHPVPAKRNIEIVPKPTGERHMPSSPEIGYGICDIRVVEVCRKIEAKDAGDANRHIRIPGEIKINL